MIGIVLAIAGAKLEPSIGVNGGKSAPPHAPPRFPLENSFASLGKEGRPYLGSVCVSRGH